jgi:hypothetical protein
MEMHTAARLRWQSEAIAFATITLAIVVPGIVLCRIV